MRNPNKIGVAVATLTSLALVASTTAALAAEVNSTNVKRTDTSLWTPPSPDPSGITYIPAPVDRLVVADAEVDEIPAPQPGEYKGVNLYTMTRDGTLTGTGTTKEPTFGTGTGWSVEPTGLAYHNGKMYVADDDKKSVFTITSAGGDGVYGTADDLPATPNGFKTSTFGNTDPEGVAIDTLRNEMLLINGQTGARYYILQPGVNGVFDGVAPGGDDIPIERDLERYGVIDPEGIAYDAQRDTILISSDGSQKIYELDRNGALLNTINIASMNAVNAADLVIAPSSTGTGRSYYLVDRGLDNNSHPTENDGAVFEIKANPPPITNHPPVADAGVDQLLDLGETVTLSGAVLDMDATDTHTFTWTATGPGTATMATPNASSTTATFSAAGNYTFRLTVRDSKGATAFDEATIQVFNPGAARDVALPVLSGLDDAQEGIGGADDKYTDVSSADNELGHNGNASMQRELTGLRFGGLPVPKGSEIVQAFIQFKVDEGSSGAAALTVVGEAADNAASYVQGRNANISSRPKTVASVPWSPPTWTAPTQPGGGASGPDQQTPDLKAVLQEIVDRPGWQKGNAAAFMVWGTGRRTAEAKDGLTPPVLMLKFKSPLPNTAPVVDAGPNRTVTMPDAANLDGTVTDDGKPAPVTSTWTKVSGPGTVTFANPNAVDTTATFSVDGSYVLRLTASDSALSGQDTMTVTVRPAATPPPPNTPPAVVTPSLTAQVSSSLVKVGKKAKITGTLSPAFAGQTVKLQQSTGSGWSDLATSSVPGGTSATVEFTATSGSSGSIDYRLTAPATPSSTAVTSNTVTVLYHRLKVVRVIWKADVVKVRNVGRVRVDVQGWTLKNKKNRKSVVLPSHIIKPGKVLKIHTGDGRSRARHLYLDTRQMWGKHGKAILTDALGSRSHRLRY